MRPKLVVLAISLVCSMATSSVLAQTVTAPGWIYASQTLGDTLQSCVQSALGGTFVGVGPGFSGSGQSVVFVTEAGGERIVATGFNSIGDCVYDAASDVLYVSDNALEAVGAATGDTVFAIASASTAIAVAALGAELVPAGSIPSASSLALDAEGDVYVSDAIGGGAGSVQKISAGVMTPFATGFDFTGGIAIDADGDLFVAESLPSFENQISRFDPTGAPLGVVAGPSFGFGSVDMEVDGQGRPILTGLFFGDVVTVDPGDASETALASGFTFATGIERDDFTGRLQLASSTFVPETEDFRLHKLVPIDRLVAGNGPPPADCLHEAYGVELVAAKPGKKAKKAICVDGAACDADAAINDSCTYPIGFCLNVPDPALGDCLPDVVATFELKKSKPDSAGVQAAVAAAQAAAPVGGTACFFGDGAQVPLKINKKGVRKPGKGKVKVKAKGTALDGKTRTDVDVIKLVCLPAP